MEDQKTVFTSSVDETEAFGSSLAKEIQNDPALPSFVALCGDLGVGKTAFVRGFVSVISPASTVRSPTFSLVNEYRSAKTPVFHFDLYRIEDEDDLASIGYDDYLTRKGICLVEWSEKIPEALPKRRFVVSIEKDNPAFPDHRKITLKRLEG